MTDIFPPPFSVVVQEIDALENTETQHGHLMALMRHRAMLAAAPQPPVVEQPQVEQEPVAYYVMNGAALFQLFRSKSQADALAYDLQKRHDLSGSPAHFHVVPLYTHPQPCQPLTDAQINDHRLALPHDGEDLPDPWDFKQGVRAAERAHGIGGEA